MYTLDTMKCVLSVCTKLGFKSTNEKYVRISKYITSQALLITIQYYSLYIYVVTFSSLVQH